MLFVKNDMADKQSHHIHVKTQLPDLKSSLLKIKKLLLDYPSTMQPNCYFRIQMQIKIAIYLEYVSINKNVNSASLVFPFFFFNLTDPFTQDLLKGSLKLVSRFKIKYINLLSMLLKISENSSH